MADAFEEVFATLKQVFRPHLRRLDVQADTGDEYTLVGRVPSPFKQHKGNPMFFASVRIGKAYVSFHLLPLYMNPTLTATISPALKKRMQGKACFNFKSMPDAALLADLKRLTQDGFKSFDEKHWL
jgi:hypothetical protein